MSGLYERAPNGGRVFTARSVTIGDLQRKKARAHERVIKHEWNYVVPLVIAVITGAGWAFMALVDMPSSRMMENGYQQAAIEQRVIELLGTWVFMILTIVLATIGLVMLAIWLANVLWEKLIEKRLNAMR